MDRLSPAHAFKTPGDQDPGQVSTILAAAADDDGGSGLQNFLLRLCELCERVDREDSEGEGREDEGCGCIWTEFPEKEKNFSFTVHVLLCARMCSALYSGHQ